MKTELWLFNKTSEQYLNEGINQYLGRIRKYIPFDLVEIKTARSKDPKYLMEEEKNLVLKKLDKQDHLILLDERGKTYDSRSFAAYLQKQFSHIPGKMIFLIGGAFGFHQELYEKARQKIALSKMTFNHDLCRLVFMEQLYRALTIINKHPYHN